uniref:Uncharacterized protein n=1 Tax=Anguilla anguilla TaxID=7936 RepID=A0A0E9S7Y4_ANGAN
MMSLETSLDTAHTIENSTKEQNSCVEWHQLRRSRVTSSKFREAVTPGDKALPKISRKRF